MYVCTSTLSQKLYPPCLKLDFYPRYMTIYLPPPPQPTTIIMLCDHNAMPAFQQKKISHYTTALMCWLI